MLTNVFHVEFVEGFQMIACEAKRYDDDVLPTTRGVLLQRVESVRRKPLLEANATLPYHSMRVLKLSFLYHCMSCRTDLVRIYVTFLHEIEWQTVRGKQDQHIVAFFLELYNMRLLLNLIATEGLPPGTN